MLQRRSPPRDERQRATAVESRLRLQTSIRLRWFAVVGQLIAIGVVYFGLQFPLPIGYCLLFIALSAWLNVFLRLRYAARHVLGRATTVALLTYDLVQLTALLYLTGGIENPFVFLIVAPVIVSAATLPQRETVAIGALAASAATMLVVWHLPLPWSAPGALVLPLIYKLAILASVLTCMAFMAVYAWRLTKEARMMAAALAATEIVLGREQKLQALDGLAAAAAHELGTPLSTIAVVSKELEREIIGGSRRIDPELVEDIRLLRTQALRCREILQKLSRQPSEPDPMHATLSVSQLIDEAAKPYRDLERRIMVEAGPQPGLTGAFAREPISRRLPGIVYGLGNLIENASDYARTTVSITARWNEAEVSIAIADDGPGIPPEILEALGEPYVTTRAARRTLREPRAADDDDTSGLGLGFFIAKTLLERSGARVAFGNRPQDGGAVVTILWPRATFDIAETAGGRLLV